MSNLFPPGSPVMFSARKGDSEIVHQIGVVVAYEREPHPTSYALVRVASGYTVEMSVNDLSAVEFERRLPATSCENDDHAFAGQCDADCEWLVNAMSDGGGGESMVYGDYLGGTSSVDVSGCHRGPQQAEYVAHLDTLSKAVQMVYLHYSGCECYRPSCPEVLAEAAWMASPEGQAWQVADAARKAAHEADMAALRAARATNV